MKISNLLVLFPAVGLRKVLYFFRAIFISVYLDLLNCNIAPFFPTDFVLLVFTVARTHCCCKVKAFVLR